jgi:pyruvate formate lyase activating enzyme
LFDEGRCLGFGDCIKRIDGVFSIRNGQVEIKRENSKDAGSYQEICPSGAITVAGYDRTIDQVLAEIEKDEPFFRMSGGGITLSGGEPFVQEEWLFDLVRELKKKKIAVAAETCLQFSTRKLARFIPLIAEFLVDLKHVSHDKFKAYTGGNLDLVIKNLHFLDEQGANYRLRIPVIPGFNHTFPEMKQIINFSSTLNNCRRIDFIPFHSYGEAKYKMLGRDYLYAGVPSVGESALEQYRQYAIEKGFTVTIGG